MLARQLDEPRAPLHAERPSGRVLEGRDRVEERDVAAAAKLGFERVEVEALVVHRQRYDLDAFAREDLQRPIVGRRLHEDATGLPQELRGNVEDEALEPAGRDEDAARLNVVTRCERLPQRPVAAARPVRENRRPVALESRTRTVGDERRIEAFGRRSAARKRDRSHASSLPTRARLGLRFWPQRVGSCYLEVTGGTRRPVRSRFFRLPLQRFRG